MMRVLRTLLKPAWVVIGLVFMGATLYAQEGRYVLNWQANQTLIIEEDDKQVVLPYMAFEGMTLSADRVPRYQRSFRLTQNEVKFQLTNIYYEPIPDSLLCDGILPENLPPVKPRIKVLGAGRSVKYLEVKFPAVRVGDDGVWERLVSFEIASDPEKGFHTVVQHKSAASSMLGSGNWYKFKVTQTGIYKLSYEDLSSIGLSSPANVRIFGYGGHQVDMTAGSDRPEDMAEIAFYMNKGSDNSFNAGDYILFYAEGPVSWDYDENQAMFRQNIHPYSEEIFYFITSSHGAGQQIEQVDNRSLVSNQSTSTYDAYKHYEEENYNLIGSGRTWYAHTLNSTAFEKSYTFSDIVSQEPVKVLASVAGRSINSRSATLMVDGRDIETHTFSTVNTSLSWTTYAYENTFYHEFPASSSSVKVGMKYGVGDNADKAFLDYYTVNARCAIKYNGNDLFFRNIETVGEGNVTDFEIQAVSGNYQVWNVTDVNNIYSIRGESSGGNYHFKDSSNALKEYVVLNLSYDYPRPIISSDEPGVGSVSNQNIRAMEAQNYIIVAPNEFKDQANRLADFHEETNNLRVAVVSPSQIYNEFSSGTPDASAIRDFLRHQYRKSPESDPLKYVLLFGDGSFDNKNTSAGNTNYILTYQSLNALRPTQSYVSDDFYGLLDDGEGDVNGELVGKLDIGIGRFPVKMVEGEDTEAKTAVDKVLHYKSSPFTDWRRRLCFLGDDGYDPGGFNDGVGHMNDADTMANYIEASYPGFELKKIYMDAYPQVNSSTGQRYPEARQELINMFNRGMLFFFYAGHGSENQLSGEAMLNKQDVSSMKNLDFMPLFITATCQFSRYDNVAYENETEGTRIAKTSAGEYAFLNSQGGAIALLTTTRVVYSSQNRALSLKVMENIFRNDANGEPYRLGEIIRMAKNQLTADNKLNFALLGDPAMCLNYPRYQVITDSINELPVDDAFDTLKAFSYVTIAGHVANEDSVLLPNFNGLVYPNVFDKSQMITSFGNDNQPPFTFRQQQNLLFKGKATVRDGRFRFSFIVPRDINYNVDKGKISYYAENGIFDARGEFTQVDIGGTDTEAEMDFDSPLIELFMNNDYFEDGDMTNSEPYIYAKLFDESGINTTGVGIGHDIVAVLDDASEAPYVLNDYYEATVDDFRSGSVRYQIFDLDEGYHNLTMRAWDVFNNSGESSIGFVVESSDGLVLKDVLNYPNPANEITRFQYSHNAPDEVHQITLEIFDISGRMVARHQTSSYTNGFITEPIEWNLRTGGGVSLNPGVYPYRLRVSTSLGTSFIDQKLIIIR